LRQTVGLCGCTPLRPSQLNPGEKVSVHFSLDQIAYRIPKGHRLRIALSTSYWPFVWPSPELVTLSISNGKLGLPIKTANNDLAVAFESAETSPEWQAEQLRAASSTREATYDSETHEHLTVIRNDFGEFKDSDHGLVNGSIASELWSIKSDDPLSARAELHWEQTGGRDDWHWRTDAHVNARCDATHFYITAKIVAYNNGDMLFEHDYEDSIARQFI